VFSLKLPNIKLPNIKGDLFATIVCFGLSGIIRLGSSLILTRILHPEAYGIVTILMSITFVVELLADVNVTLFIVRDKDGDQPRYLNTAWTLRLGRSVLNSVIVFACAPLIASSLYHLPALLIPLRVYSLSFVIGGLESMTFPLAIRRKESRLFLYSELLASFFSTVFAVIYCYYTRDFWGMVYGALVNRALMSIFSYCAYRDTRPKLQLDWGAARNILQFTKFTMPSSALTLALSQFDKVTFLRLFDLKLLGVYGLGSNMASPVEAIISRISQMVLYPRCAHNFRADPDTFALKYYTENVRLFAGILFLPAAVGGAAHLIIGLFYPPQYVLAGAVLQAFMLRAAFLSLASPAEDLLIAAGSYHVILVGNICRTVTMIIASLGAYYIFGFMGFIYGFALSGLPPLVYYWWLQRDKGMLIVRYELYKLGFLAVVAVLSFFVSDLLLKLLGRGP
jgi:O-antigen/teichoic acid export membrane protein